MHIIRTERNKGSFWRTFFNPIFKNHLFESAATLSYYFLFSVFPLAILISSAFSTLNIATEKLGYLARFVPEQILVVLQGYLTEIAAGNTPTLMLIGILLTFYSVGKGLQAMKRRFRLAYGVEPKISWTREWLITFIFVFLVLVSFYASLILIVAGNYILNFLVASFPFLNEIRSAIRVIRYGSVTAFLAFVIFGLYYVLPGIKQKKRFVLPGTLFTLAAWMVMSWLFSLYFTHFANYASLYGSLGTIIALLTWLYLINTIILFGAHINSYIYNRITDRNHEEHNSLLH